jgi:hypothetical protein
LAEDEGARAKRMTREKKESDCDVAIALNGHGEMCLKSDGPADEGDEGDGSERETRG